MIIFGGIEWDYNNLQGIGYDSETLLEPYATWFYQITTAINYEKENINLNLSDDGEYSSVYKTKDSVIRLRDKSKRNGNRKDVENIILNETYNRKIERFYKEDFELNDGYVHKITKKNKESTFYFLDECRFKYQRYDSQQPVGPEVTVDQVELSGSACLFDFEAKKGIWNEGDFAEWCENNCPINYNELRPFIPGEYEYKDAYVGFRLTIPPTSGRFGVAHSTVYIDIEDTVEKGTSEHTLQNDEWITEGCVIDGDTATVNFSKRFYTWPHIISSLNFSEENCYIEVVERNKEWFKFKIKSVSTGSYVTSTRAWSINWLADGY